MAKEVRHVHHHYEPQEYKPKEMTGWEVATIILIVIFAPIIVFLAIALLPLIILIAIPVLIFYGLFLFFAWMYNTITGKKEMSSASVELDEI